MDDHNAMLAIQEILDGTEWSSDTTQQIADVLVAAGYRVRDLADVDHEARS